MTEILDHALSLPTAIFSALLGLVALYWVISLLGIFSLEIFEAAEGMAEGAAEGLADAAADGLAEAAEGLTDGERQGFFKLMGFGDVPRSISWSLVIFFSWFFCLLGSIYLPRFTTFVVTGVTIVTLGMIGLSLVLAVGVTSLAIQPLRRVLLAGYGTKRRDLIGRLCVVKTLRVDEEFGQAELDDGSSLIQVRNSQGFHFENGSSALIYEYDAAREVFYIVPSDAGELGGTTAPVSQDARSAS